MRGAENPCSPLITCSLKFRFYVNPGSWDVCSVVTMAIKKNQTDVQGLKWKGTVSCPTCSCSTALLCRGDCFSILSAVPFVIYFHIYKYCAGSVMKNEVTNTLQIQVGSLGPCFMSPYTSLRLVARPFCGTSPVTGQEGRKGAHRALALNCPSYHFH